MRPLPSAPTAVIWPSGTIRPSTSSTCSLSCAAYRFPAGHLRRAFGLRSDDEGVEFDLYWLRRTCESKRKALGWPSLYAGMYFQPAVASIQSLCSSFAFPPVTLVDLTLPASSITSSIFVPSAQCSGLRE